MKSSWVSVMVCWPSDTFVNTTVPELSVGTQVALPSRLKQNSPSAAVDSKLPLPSRSIFFMTVIRGNSMIWLAGTGTFCAPVCFTSPPAGLSRLCCDEPLQSPAWSERVSV